MIPVRYVSHYIPEPLPIPAMTDKIPLSLQGVPSVSERGIQYFVIASLTA